MCYFYKTFPKCKNLEIKLEYRFGNDYILNAFQEGCGNMREVFGDVVHPVIISLTDATDHQLLLPDPSTSSGWRV